MYLLSYFFFAKKKDNSNGCVTRGGRKAFGMLWKYSLAKTAIIWNYFAASIVLWIFESKPHSRPHLHSFTLQNGCY